MGFILYYLLFALPVIAASSFLIYLPFYDRNRHRYGKRPLVRHTAIFGLIGVTLSILYATIFIMGADLTFRPGYHLLNLVPFAWVRKTYEMGAARMAEQLIMNTVMLIPMGFLLPMVFAYLRRWWRTGLIVMALILIIETVQYFIGRSADIDDLIMNTLGGLLGYGLYRVCNRVFLNRIWWQRALNDRA